MSAAKLLQFSTYMFDTNTQDENGDEVYQYISQDTVWSLLNTRFTWWGDTWTYFSASTGGQPTIYQVILTDDAAVTAADTALSGYVTAQGYDASVYHFDFSCDVSIP